MHATARPKASPAHTIHTTLSGRRHSRRKVDQAGHAPVLRLERGQSLLELHLLQLEARARRRNQRAAEGVAARQRGAEPLDEALVRPVPAVLRLLRRLLQQRHA